MKALAQLVEAGKIRHIGLSEVSAATISKAHKYSPSPSFNLNILYGREPEKEIIPLCKKLNIGFVAHGPIGKGFLSGTIHSVDSLAEDDVRRWLPRFQEENINYNLSIVNILKEIARSKNATPAQIALAWLLAQGDHIVAIPGAKCVDHLEENINATRLHLSQEELLQIGNRIPMGFAQGASTLNRLLNFPIVNGSALKCCENTPRITVCCLFTWHGK